MNKRRAVIDDGMNPELVRGARFDGIFEIPIIEKPSRIFVPSAIVPFSQRNRVADKASVAVGFYEMDVNFAEVLRNPERFTDEFRQFGAIISLDCSLYRDMPFAAQVTNVYRNRAVGCYWQRCGCNMIPQVRWGSKETYAPKLFKETIAFSGVERHSIVAIGTYGCIKGAENEEHFKAGLAAMLDELAPEIVLVYGSMPSAVFDDFRSLTKFVQYPDWTTLKHQGDC